MGERPAPVPGVEPLFTDEDATEILDFLADEHLVCSGCGELKVESFDPVNEGAYRAVPLACHACAAKRKAERKLDDSDGVYTVVKKR